MSWQTYIDTLKSADQSGTAPVAEAAIWGYKPGQESQWASSGLAGITADEIKKLVGDRSGFGQTGVFISGQKCRMLRDQLDSDPIFSLDLKTAADAEGNTYSVCVGKTMQALVIAKGTKEASGGQVSNKVFNVVSHLRKTNY